MALMVTIRNPIAIRKGMAIVPDLPERKKLMKISIARAVMPAAAFKSRVAQGGCDRRHLTDSLMDWPHSGQGSCSRKLYKE